jgi:hypothetical protein
MGAINERRWLALVFSLYFLLAVGYSLLMPIWEAPDEPAHYQIAWHLARLGRFPSLKHNYEMNQPKGFYYLGAGVIRGLDKVDRHFSDYYLPHEYTENINVPIRRFDWTADNYRFLLGVYMLRWVNILFGAAALWLNWKAYKIIAPEKPTLCIAALALAALTPQYLHIMSSVSNDALGTLAGALLFYLAIRMTAMPSNSLIFFLIPLAIVLPLLTKLTVLPVSAAVLIMIAWNWFSQPAKRRWLIYSGLIVLVVGGILYFLFPETIQPALHEISWRLFSFRPNVMTWKYLTFITEKIISSYWGKVGWLAAELPIPFIAFLSLFGLIGMVASLQSFIKTKSQATQPQLWKVVWLITLFSIAAVARNGLTTSATKGRFLFPAIGALSILMVNGWYDLLPQRYQSYLPVIVTIFMVCCNLVIWFFGVLPIYYQPFLD